MGTQCSLARTDVTEANGHEGSSLAETRHVSMVSDTPRFSAPEPDCCAMCLQPLADKGLGVCIGTDSRRVCQHYFHLSCLKKVHPLKCPQCRAPFERCAGLPHIGKDPIAWGQFVAVCGTDAPTKREVLNAFKAMLREPAEDVEKILATVPGWHGKTNYVSEDFLYKLAKTAERHIQEPTTTHDDDASPHDSSARSSGVHRSSNVPGAGCSCGRVHAHRGDRVRRGPAWGGGNQDGGVGHLGTVVRDDEGSNVVCVQWDCTRPGDVQRYAWPADPTRHEVEHVPFEEVDRDVRRVQEETGLSSAAAAELLRRPRPGADRARGVAATGTAPTETELRERPKLFHRCRVLPEQELVREWFDACPPCPCSRPDCRGGVRWNNQAARHLGREGYLLKIDERDGTVLVELTGRCNCKVWYPFLAVQPVYDPDTAIEPRFRAGTQVECRIDGDWHKGMVSRVWWRPSSGWGNKSTVPYSVKLLDGRSVFAPRDSNNLIRAVESLPASARTRSDEA